MELLSARPKITIERAENNFQFADNIATGCFVEDDYSQIEA